MRLWLISQTVNNDYDTYDGAVVAAESKKEAQRILPAEWAGLSEWAKPKDVKVNPIGIAKEGTKAGVILASFNAG